MGEDLRSENFRTKRHDTSTSFLDSLDSGTFEFRFLVARFFSFYVISVSFTLLVFLPFFFFFPLFFPFSLRSCILLFSRPVSFVNLFLSSNAALCILPSRDLRSFFALFPFILLLSLCATVPFPLFSTR